MNVQLYKASGKAKNRRKEKNMNNTTKIVGWTRKKAFDGTIDGRHIQSPAKVVFHIETTNVRDHHGVAVDTLKLNQQDAIAWNGGVDDYDNLIGAEIRLDYQLVNGKPMLVDIVVLSTPKK